MNLPLVERIMVFYGKLCVSTENLYKEEKTIYNAILIADYTILKCIMWLPYRYIMFKYDKILSEEVSNNEIDIIVNNFDKYNYPITSDDARYIFYLLFNCNGDRNNTDNTGETNDNNVEEERVQVIDFLRVLETIYMYHFYPTLNKNQLENIIMKLRANIICVLFASYDDIKQKRKRARAS